MNDDMSMKIFKPTDINIRPLETTVKEDLLPVIDKKTKGLGKETFVHQSNVESEIIEKHKGFGEKKIKKEVSTEKSKLFQKLQSIKTDSSILATKKMSSGVIQQGTSQQVSDVLLKFAKIDTPLDEKTKITINQIQQSLSIVQALVDGKDVRSKPGRFEKKGYAIPNTLGGIFTRIDTARKDLQSLKDLDPTIKNDLAMHLKEVNLAANNEADKRFMSALDNCKDACGKFVNDRTVSASTIDSMYTQMFYSFQANKLLGYSPSEHTVKEMEKFANTINKLNIGNQGLSTVKKSGENWF